MRKRPEILAAVEGLVDEAVVRRIAEEVGAAVSVVYGRQGKDDLRQRLAAYNNAARLGAWLVLVDLNDDADCAPQLVAEWLPNPSSNMCFRVAVRMVEAWILADPDHLAAFLCVPPGRIPACPELEADPKQVLMNLARQSRRREIREDMMPRPQSGRRVGPAYASRLIEFVQSTWSPGAAARHSESLRRCLLRLRDVTGQA